MRTRNLSFTMLLTLAVAVVAFAALELLAVQAAFAGKVCCSDTTLKDCKCDGAVLPTCDSTMNNLKSVLTGTFKNYRTGPVKTNNTLT
jgi:hypothetical protein